MPPLPRPHRVTFLPAIATLPAGDHKGRIFGELLQRVVFGHLLEHPVVSMTDPDDRDLADAHGFALDANHPEFGRILGWELGTARRDEVLWLELTLVPGASAMPRLHTRSADGNAAVYTSSGSSLGSGLEGAIGAWLEARYLPPAPGPLTGFTGEDVRATADWIEAMVRQASDPEADSVILTSPPVPALAVAGLRALTRIAPSEADLGEQIDTMVLEHEADNVIAKRNDLVRRINSGQGGAAEAARLIAQAPQWSKLHLLVAGELAPEDTLRHLAIACAQAPESIDAATSYSAALLAAGRPEEAYREADRARRVEASSVAAYSAAVRALRATRRVGEAFLQARHGWNAIGDLWSRGELPAAEEPAIRRAQHLLAATHLDVGRLDEALAIARRGLEDVKPPVAVFLRDVRTELDVWETDPLVLCAAYARDGHARRDPGRVLEGLGHGRALDGRDVAQLIDALIALGREDQAALAWAHLDGAGRASEPVAWLAGARALLVAGDLATAEGLLRRAVMAGGAARLDLAVHRVLRLYPIHPAAEWEKVLAARLDGGAVTLARMLARDLGDFVPGMAASEAFKRALPARARRAYDPAWLEPLRQALGASASDPIDGLFSSTGSHGALDAADLLVGRWPDFLSPQLPSEGRTGEVVWTLAQALTRYFALTSGAPMPFGGGLRQVASEALAYLERQASEVNMGAIRALLETLEPAGAGVEPWIFDSWILRIERALDIEGRVAGQFGPFLTGLPLVADSLRGPERVAFELRLAVDLKDDGDPTNDDQARVLFERSLRAAGTSAIASGWSEVPSGLPPAAALDVHFTTAAAAAAHPVPHLNLARALLAVRRSERALGAMLVAMPLLDGTAREQRLAELKAQFERAGLDIPYEWGDAQDAGLTHLEAGRAEQAERCFRWCNAIDPRNSGMLKNLGLACAGQGKAAETVAAFSGVDEVEGPKLAGHALLQARQHKAAVLALRYASTWFADAADWLVLGGAAWMAEDDETAVWAYSRAYELREGRLAPSELASYAAALYTTGDFERCEVVARAVLEAAVDADDPALRSAGHHAMARALLGQGRVVEAVPYAQRALAANPLAEGADQLAETLSRAQRGEPYPLRPAGPGEVARRAFSALAAGDAKAASSIAAAAPGWAAARAALSAAALRSDAHAPVAYPALRVIAAQLDASAGATERDAALWRVHALALREDATFALDPPPPLGPRLERSEFERLLVVRLEEEEPTIMKEVVEGSLAAFAVPVSTSVAPPMGEDDHLVFPGTKIPRLSDYVEVMKAMQGADPLGTLAKLGLDMAGYAQLASQWGQRLASDPELSAKFTEKMTQ